MTRRKVQLESETRLVPVAGTLDEQWNDAAARLLASLAERRPAELGAELESFLRRFIAAKARRWSRRLGERAQGVNSEDVVQHVLLQLFEHPPNREAAGRPMRRLVSWVNTVTHNYLYDLASRPAERLTSSRREDKNEGERAVPSRSAPTESRYAAREALLLLRPALEKDYPIGLALLELLVDTPHATSHELARRLGTTAANVDQMRSRIRRVLRRHLGESDADRRKSR
jgi:DNA-directed RNA polymerase specialized sigma24 family protein